MPEAGKPPAEIRGHGIGIVRVIGSIGLVMSALIGMATPALYYTFAIRAERQALEIETAYTAKAVQSIIFSRPEMWEFETVRLLEIVSKRAVDDEEHERTMYGASGKIVVETKYKAPAPFITSTAPIFVSGDKVGAVRAKRSVRDILWGTIFAGILGSAFGLGVYLLFRSYPLRLLKEALTGLASEKEKTETTLSSIGDGVMTVDREGRITGFGGESGAGIRSGFYTGFQIVEPEALRRIPGGKPSCIVRDTYAPLVRDGGAVFGFLSSGHFQEFGSPSDYLNGTLAVLAGRSGEITPPPAPEGTVVIPPAYIGPGAKIGIGAHIGPDAVIEGGAVVGEGATVTRSILWSGSSLAAGERLRNAILTPRRRVEIPEKAQDSGIPGRGDR